VTIMHSHDGSLL